MWICSRLSSGISSATSTRTRRFSTLIVASCLVVLVWRNYPSHTGPGRVSNSCLDVALYQFIAAERRGETSIARLSHLVSSSPAAILGNGHIGIDLYDNKLLFEHDGVLSLSATYSPQLSLTVQGQVLSPDAYVFEYKEGTYHYIYAHSMSSGCLQARHSIHVHRNISSLIVQDIWIHNGVSSQTLVGVKQLALSTWTGSSTTRNNIGSDLKVPFASEYILTKGSVPATLKTPTVDVAVASVAAPNSVLEIAANKEVSMQLVSAVVFEIGQNLSSATPKPAQPAPKNLGPRAVVELEQHLKVTNQALEDRRLKHVTQWTELWSTMPHVLSKSHPSTPGNAEIFACLFYLMASTPYTSGRAGVDSVVHPEKECFSGPPTMHTTSLWLVPRGLSAAQLLVRNWHRTLAHGACDLHLYSGAQLLGQVVTLSFLGFRFVPASKYLDLALNPALIQADALVHNLYFSDHSFSLNIQMEGGAARKMLVSAVPLRTDKVVPSLYACPASCAGQPIPLSSQEVALPVIATKPVTPLLYLSTHLNQLSLLQNKSRELQTYHLPGEHHHEWGVHTVSPRVWIVLGFLLAAFHVFLFRIVMNEYCPDACSLADWRRVLPKWMIELCSSARTSD